MPTERRRKDAPRVPAILSEAESNYRSSREACTTRPQRDASILDKPTLGHGEDRMHVSESLLLTRSEIEALTCYKRPCDQLRELHRQGFMRARKALTGGVILERAHYDSVCRGLQPAERPRVRPPRLKMA